MPFPSIPGIPEGVPYDIELDFVCEFVPLGELEETMLDESVIELVGFLKALHGSQADSMEVGATHGNYWFLLRADKNAADAMMRVKSCVMVDRHNGKFLFKLGPPEIRKVGVC